MCYCGWIQICQDSPSNQDKWLLVGFHYGPCQIKCLLLTLTLFVYWLRICWENKLRKAGANQSRTEVCWISSNEVISMCIEPVRGRSSKPFPISIQASQTGWRGLSLMYEMRFSSILRYGLISPILFYSRALLHTILRPTSAHNRLYHFRQQIVPICLLCSQSK